MFSFLYGRIQNSNFGTIDCSKVLSLTLSSYFQNRRRTFHSCMYTNSLRIKVKVEVSEINRNVMAMVRLTHNWYNRAIYIGARFMIFGWFWWMPNIIISAKTFKSFVTISHERSELAKDTEFMNVTRLFVHGKFVMNKSTNKQNLYTNIVHHHLCEESSASCRSWYYYCCCWCCCCVFKYPCESDECYFLNFFVISKRLFDKMALK